MASCSLGPADFKVSSLRFSRAKVSTLPPCCVRSWVGSKPQRLVISNSPHKALHVCCSTSAETQTVTRPVTSSEEIKYSNSARHLIPSPHEVETLLTNICDTTSIAEFQLKLRGFELHVTRGLTSGDLPPPAIPALIGQNTSSAHSDSNGSVKSTALAVYKPEPISSSSSEGVSRILDRATDEGLAILQSPRVGFFRRSRTIKGKRAPPSCKEKQIVKEGQVICYVEQLGAEIPIESDVSGEVINILRKDGEPIGYGDALIAILPSFPGIK